MDQQNQTLDFELDFLEVTPKKLRELVNEQNVFLEAQEGCNAVFQPLEITLKPSQLGAFELDSSYRFAGSQEPNQKSSCTFSTRVVRLKGMGEIGDRDLEEIYRKTHSEPDVLTSRVLSNSRPVEKQSS